MRQLGRIDAPPAVVHGMFSNLSRWTAWMPGVQSVSLLEEADDAATALIRQRWMGRTLTQKWSFRFGEETLEQRLLEGFFRSWTTHWRFLAAPCGGPGTTVVATIHFNAGILGRLAPRGVLQDAIDRMFAEVIDKGRARARAILARETLSGPVRLSASSVLEVYDHDGALELHFGGRRYRLEPIGD